LSYHFKPLKGLSITNVRLPTDDNLQLKSELLIRQWFKALKIVIVDSNSYSIDDLIHNPATAYQSVGYL
jgi:hypothetical protein